VLSRDELAAWLQLATTPGIGRSVARRLLAALGSAECVVATDEDTLASLAGPDVARLLKRRDARDDLRLATTQRWLAASTSQVPHDIVVLGDPRYPELLVHTADPPLLLFTRGRVDLLSAPGVAIVGSRSATPQGMDNARAFARFLSERKLTQRIAEEGLVASEYTLGTDATSHHFPRRNRLIAGITHGTLVVEAAVESGSLITARMALEAGREVFAVPGSIHSPQSRGCHRLIQEGAKLVETGQDILDELGRVTSSVPLRAVMSARQPSLFATTSRHEQGTSVPDGRDAGPDAALRAALGHDPVTFDALAARTGLPSDRLAARLLELELAGEVQRLPGGLLQRRATT
jgi:DNA processing protein